jgi:P-type Ca2+ transporter type 2C
VTAPSLPSVPEAPIWHTQSTTEVLQYFKTVPETGLTNAQVEASRAIYQYNELTEAAGRSLFDLILDQVKNVLVLMLIGAAVVALLVGDTKSTISIMVIVAFNTILGVVQESRAEKAMAALKRMSSPNVTVLRNGQEIDIPAKELVPGDIFIVEAGDSIAADARVIESANMQAREAALTGEATTVQKSDKPLNKSDAPLGDRANMLFMGTEITHGRGAAVVTGTGMRTELGKIAGLIQGVQDEQSPLQQRMGRLGNFLVFGSLAIIAVVMVGGLLAGAKLEELALSVISIAVAVVPEGLPAVITITLALGAQRMVKRNVLIRKLPAVETLGSVNTIASDKTGTLTQNKMVVTSAHTHGNSYAFSGTGYDPAGSITRNDKSIYEADVDLNMLLTASVAANDASLNNNSGTWEVVGDPTEGALIVAGAKAGISRDGLRRQLLRVAEAAFTSERKKMSVYVTTKEAGILPYKGHEAPIAIFTKGSPELVLALCTQALVDGQTVPMSDFIQKKALSTNDQLAGDGIRVLGFAYKPVSVKPAEGKEEAEENSLIWLGMIAMLDAPRPEVKPAVVLARKAGIRPIMITGDHKLTAMAIARDLGIAKPGQDKALIGADLDKMTDDQLRQEADSVSVYARVSPEHKLRIVRALQARDQFVAMTGDGVNDAPALKQANIGVAMGITGTDVTKEASDMILTDDNFASIVAAAEEGRTIYGNVRKFVKYILTSNIGEVMTLAFAPLFGLPVPLLPMQILYMNLVTDGIPALALAVDPKDKDVMEKPPYGTKESIFSRGLGSYMVRVGIIFGIIGISFMLFAKFTLGSDNWQSMVFTMLCISQMGHALAVRHEKLSIFQIGLGTNKWLLLAVVLTTLIQLALLYITPIAQFFELKPLTGTEFLYCIAGSTLLFIYVEIEKLVRRTLEARKAKPA